jgi:hypothetical protein
MRTFRVHSVPEQRHRFVGRLPAGGHIAVIAEGTDRYQDATGGRTLLLHACSGSADVDAVVTAFVLAATRALVSADSIGRIESSAMGSVRACVR